MAGTSTSGAVVLPSVSTILAPTSSCSVNAALISVLSVPEASLAAIPLQTGAESAAFDTAEDADSESQEGETDPPGYKNCSSSSSNCFLLFMVEKGKEGQLYVCLLISSSEG